MINTHDGAGQFHQEFVAFRLTIWIRMDGADCAHGAKAIRVGKQTANGIANPKRKCVVRENGRKITGAFQRMVTDNAGEPTESLWCVAIELWIVEEIFRCPTQIRLLLYLHKHLA